MQPAHHFNVEWLQRMACRLDKVDTRMDSVVNNIHPVNLVLRGEITNKALFNILDNGSPRVVIVDEVTKTWCIDHGET